MSTKVNWRVLETPCYMEIIPIGDCKNHYAGDECWCNPRLERVANGTPELMIVHEALDGRE